MHYVIFSFILWLVIGSTTSVGNQTPLQAYEEKVCNHEPTCNLINEPYLRERHRNLEGRDCLCDSECVEFGDCCSDSEFFAHSSNTSGKSYSCSLSSKIYMIATCPAGYSNQAILSKCLASLKPLKGADNSVIRPATNLKTRITYGNLYCAACNDDINVTLWNITSRCGEIPAGYFDSTPAIRTKSETNTETPTQAPKIPTKPPQMEITTTSAKPKVTSTTASSKTSKPLISLSLGSNPGIEINIGDKNFKSTLNTGTGLFRPKRQQSVNAESSTRIPGIDYNKYRKDLDNILENVHYDENTQHYISQYNGKSFICEFTSPLPPSIKPIVRICVPNMVSSCPPNTDQKTAQKCKLNTAIVYTKEYERAYKNEDCAKCNNEMKELTGCPQQDLRVTGSDIFSTSNKGATPPCDQPELKDSKMCQ